MLLSSGLILTAQSGAQESQETSAQNAEAEVIQVTGFRSSLNAALMAKRDSVGSKDVILAEDIGKFPDLNIADSLGRVPGVSVEEDGGEGRQISLRGLGPRYVKTTINGMESASAGGGSDAGGGSNTSRAFDFNIFASELFTQVDISKTPAAELEDGGIGGSVNLQAARPFQYQETKLSYNVNARYNDIAAEVTPRMSFMASKNWDNKFGILGSLAYSEGIVQQEGTTTVRWTKLNPKYDAEGSLVSEGGTNHLLAIPRTVISENDKYDNDDLDGLWIPRIPRYSIYSQEQKRLGATAAIQYAATDDLVFSLDFLHAKLDTEVNEYQYEVLFRDNANSSGVVSAAGEQYAENLVADENGVVVAGVFSSAPIRSEARKDKYSSTFNQLSLNTDWYVNQDLQVKVLVGKGTSDLDVPYKRTLALDAPDSLVAYSFDKNIDPIALINGSSNGIASGSLNSDMASFAFAPSSGTGSYSKTDLENLTKDASLYTVGLTRQEAETIESENFTFKVDFIYNLTDELTLKTGLNTRYFETERHNWRNNWRDDTSYGQNAEVAVLRDPDADLAGTNFASTLADLNVEFGNSADVPSSSTLTQSTWLAPDYDKLLAAYGDKAYFQTRERYAEAYRIKEEVDSVYAQLDFSLDWVRGNFGVRYVDNTNTAWNVKRGTYSTTSFLLNDQDLGVEWTEAKSTGKEFLPALNLAFDVTDDLVARFSASKAITRPALRELRPTISISYGETDSGDGAITIGAGPKLEPEKATQFDLGLEWYFAEESLLAGSLFYKDIATLSKKGVKQTLSREYFAAIGGDVERWSADKQWEVTQLVNNDAEGMWGAELIYQQPFTFLPAPFDQFGVLANYTYIDFKLDQTNPFTGEVVSVEPEGTSKNTFNTTLYYEQDEWSARISYNYRSAYPQEFIARNNEGNYGRGSDDKGSWKFSSRYKLNDNMSISFEAINLTNEKKNTWVDTEMHLPYESYVYGRQFLIGLRGSL
ncbi:TonB-dependent receptor [Catenovulum sp. 2E275]|uniref:TonB-dependent receptor n=1 Tax=Catenovulum sp. 2E275 TaxID=2980497 RepID=UPI0021D300F8|nr:TonB-dependent receptor [Catenovulum sp. 2E275]MCU4677035.1 TonB-dependent receptor [Catenovulum sp. 2E275]